MKTEIIIKGEFTAEQSNSLLSDVLRLTESFNNDIEIKRRNYSNDCEHYFPRNSDLTLMPCEFCGKEREDI